MHVPNNDSVSSVTPNTSSLEQIRDSLTDSISNSTVTKIANQSNVKYEVEITTIRNNITQQLPLNTTQAPVPKTNVPNDDDSKQSSKHITSTSQTRLFSIDDNMNDGGSGEGNEVYSTVSDSRQIYFKDEEVE